MNNNKYVLEIIKESDKLPPEEREGFIKEIAMGLFREAWGTVVALNAQQNWEASFEKIRAENNHLEVSADLIPEIVKAGNFSSNSEVRRIFEQGGARLRLGKKALILKLK